MSGRIKLSRAVVVEGRYDKCKLASIADAVIIVTNGFGLYRDKKTQRLIRQCAATCGLIVLTDSDAAGRQLRRTIKGIIPKENYSRVADLHIPQIKGKERRKENPSAEGTLGVEGIDADILRKMLMPYAVGEDGSENSDGGNKKGGITKNDLYELGLSGGADSSRRRQELSRRLGLPDGLSANMLLDLINTLYTREGFLAMAASAEGDENEKIQ